MNKVALDNKVFISPLPALLIGSVVNGRPNYMTAAWAGIASTEPPMITVGIEPERYTYIGVLQNMVFSANVPSRGMVEEVDFCGRESGSTVDKVEACGFRVFYGLAKAAPLIEQCPVNLECRVTHVLHVGKYVLIVGEIEGAHISEDCQTDGLPDVLKIDPIVFAPGDNTSPFYSNLYYGIGELILRSTRNSSVVREKAE